MPKRRKFHDFENGILAYHFDDVESAEHFILQILWKMKRMKEICQIWGLHPLQKWFGKKVNLTAIAGIN